MLLLATALLLAWSPAEAAEKHRRASRPEGRSRAAGPSKIAVFGFDGDEATKVRQHVVMALENRGFNVDTSLRPAQTNDEFRDMGATLNLAAYVHGRIEDDGRETATATITVRSGVTGRPIATASITGHRRGIRFDVEEKLWERVGKAISQACKHATKPRRPRNQPTHIEAGSPL